MLSIQVALSSVYAQIRLVQDLSNTRSSVPVAVDLGSRNRRLIAQVVVASGCSNRSKVSTFRVDGKVRLVGQVVVRTSGSNSGQVARLDGSAASLCSGTDSGQVADRVLLAVPSGLVGSRYVDVSIGNVGVVVANLCRVDSGVNGSLFCSGERAVVQRVLV